MENSEYFYRETMDSISEKQLIKDINYEITMASGKGLFFVRGEYNENEIDTESFVEYFKDLGFSVLMGYDQYTYKWSYKISWFKH
jgi:hypothetical protein